MLANRLQKDSTIYLTMLFICFKLFLALLGVLISVHPPPVKVSQTWRKASFEGGVVQNCGPKLFKIGIQKVIEVWNYFSYGSFVYIVEDVWLIHRLLRQHGYEFGLVHMSLVHELLFCNHCLFLRHFLLYLEVLSFAFLSHQLYFNQRFIKIQIFSWDNKVICPFLFLVPMGLLYSC